MVNFTEIKLKNPGIIKSEIPQDVMHDLQEAVAKQTSFRNKMQQRSLQRNDKLAGMIEDEFTFVQPESFTALLNNLFHTYSEHFDAFTNTEIVRHESWINLQKKTEYNPTHLHSGTLSWVVWISIPYDLSQEDAHPNSRMSKDKYNARFTFTYAMLKGAIAHHHLDIDKTWEGKIILFPSYLYHSVNPFYTSDEVRVSLAGNIWTQ